MQDFATIHTYVEWTRGSHPHVQSRTDPCLAIFCSKDHVSQAWVQRQPGMFFFHPGSWLKREKLARNSHEILWHVWESSPKFQYLTHEVMKCLAILGVLLSAVSLQNMLDKCTIVDYCGRSAKNFAEFPLHQHLAIAWPWGVSFSSSCATEGRKGSEAVSLNIGNGWNLVTFDIYDYWFMIYDAL